jgi:hypothetical protein
MELAIIDRKLDRYMTHKAKVGILPYLLIDRFRFDSFSNEPDEEDGSRLLTRFGSDVYMFFMVTPPEETIERAWKRGLQFGRYKAVDDLRTQRGGLLRHTGTVLHLGASRRQAGALRIFGQQRSGRASTEDDRFRDERSVEHPRFEPPA